MFENKINSRQMRTKYEMILYRQHIDRLNKMSAVIDTKEPKKMSFTKRKITNDIMLSKKIEKENIKLLERLALSIQRSAIDNKLSKNIYNYKKFMKRLSKIKKENEQKKITKENKTLLSRIMGVMPSYKKNINSKCV